jgi:hypothetical protein
MNVRRDILGFKSSMISTLQETLTSEATRVDSKNVADFHTRRFVVLHLANGIYTNF